MQIFKILKKSLNFLLFTDVTKTMKMLGARQACANDLDAIEYINTALKKPDPYPNFDMIKNKFRQSPMRSIMQFEKKNFLYMLCMHTLDFLASLFAVYLAMQILVTFETNAIFKFRLIDIFFDNPQISDKFFFAMILTFSVFLLNMLAASLHAQKIEREMFLEWRIPTKITQTIYHLLLNISAKEREQYKTGDITNIAQNDANYLTGFFAHGFVDFAVILIACVLTTLFLLFSIGSVAWYGVLVVLLQIPLAMFLAWCGVKLHQRRMKYTDQRIHKITELIQGMRLLRYLGWGSHFEKEIKQIATKEFIQDSAFAFQYCVSFAFTVNIWMFISSAIFAGYLFAFHGMRDASILFGIMWLAKLFGHQIAPLPWFLHTFSQSFVASKRMKKFFSVKTQDEELKPDDVLSQDDLKIINRIIHKKIENPFSVSFECKNLYFRYNDNDPYVLSNLSCTFHHNQITAITGQVGAGKSTLLKIMLGEYIPTRGTVYLILHIQNRDKNHTITLNLHTQFGLKVLRSFQNIVPQEPFIVTSTIKENVEFEYEDISEDPENDNRVMNALLKASMSQDLSQFSDHIHTEIGERGVNLSGGQKQRISIARKFYKTSKVVFMDDPFSAVDVKTEDEIIQHIFHHNSCPEHPTQNPILNQSDNKDNPQQTIIWTTHRLQHLDISNVVLVLKDGQLYES